MTESVERRGWIRARDGRAVSGVWAGLARITGASRAWLRLFSAGLTLVGAALVLLFAIFDHLIFGTSAPEAARLALIALGALLACHYPLLALVVPPERERWDLGSATAAVLLLVLLGQGIGLLCEPYWDSAKSAWQRSGSAGWIGWMGSYDFGLRDALFGLFLLTAGSFLFLQRRAVVAFFRSMQVGVTLVVLSTCAVALGVLVPQIDGFEDPDQRVDLARERADYEQFREFGYQKLPAELQDGHEQYEAFRWAEGYFLYHLLHLYGIGLPEGDLTPQQREGLERFGQRYGHEERDNRLKEMRAAFSGRQKIDEIGAFIHRNEQALWRFFEVSTQLHLNRTYKSSWFAALLTLLGLAVFFSAYKNWSFQAGRLPTGLLGALVACGFVLLLRASGALSAPLADLWPFLAFLLVAGTVLGAGVPRSALALQKLGYFVVHNGMLVLLLGGGWSKLFTDRGILQLDLRRGPQDEYYRFYSMDKKARMPFAVRLDRFARQDWLALEVHFLEEHFSSRVPRYTIWPGRELELDYVDDGRGGERPDLAIRVLAVHDVVESVQSEVREVTDPEELGYPLAELTLRGPADSAPKRAILSPLERPAQSFPGEVLRDPQGKYRLAAVFGDQPERYFPAAEGQLGWLDYRLQGEGDGSSESAPVALDETLQLPGGYSVKVVDASADFAQGRDNGRESAHPLPLAEQPPRFAALWVDITGPDGRSERRLILDGIDPLEHGLQSRYFHENLVLRFRWDPWLAPGPPRFLLHWGPGSAPRLLAQQGGQASEVLLGQPLALPPGDALQVQRLHERAVLEPALVFGSSQPRADGWDDAFYSPKPRGVVLEVVHAPGTGEERVERVEMATTEQLNVWRSREKPIGLVFLENSEMLPFEWRSVLSIIETDNAGRPFEVPLGNEREREIRVNDYFYYKGYRFFQTNADASMPTYSGIGVVYDPGISIVLTGMYMIIAGMAIAFLVRPIVRGMQVST
jgi:phage shock protein PspC (stress-responsive transcriptional regulator)